MAREVGGETKVKRGLTEVKVEKTLKEENSQLSLLPLRGSLGAKKVYQGFLFRHWWKGLW